MSEWLQPWVSSRALAFQDDVQLTLQLHYIPVSQLYSEIYNIHAYFSGPSKAMSKAAEISRSQYQPAGLTSRKYDGDQELRKIASAGREWMFKHGRKIDMESE
jgi:hypothetical protein